MGTLGRCARDRVRRLVAVAALGLTTVACGDESTSERPEIPTIGGGPPLVVTLEGSPETGQWLMADSSRSGSDEAWEGTWELHQGCLSLRIPGRGSLVVIVPPDSSLDANTGAVTIEGEDFGELGSTTRVGGGPNTRTMMERNDATLPDDACGVDRWLHVFIG